MELTGGQLIFFIVWAITAMPFVGLFDFLFSKYGSPPDEYEGDMRGMLGMIWFATLIPVLIYIGVRIILIKKGKIKQS